MNAPLELKDIMSLIENGVEENQHLEYKSAGSLHNTDGNKKEIAKDVSAMANSSGGIIIYGIKEFDLPAKKHLPEKLSPVCRNMVSKEWLEQIIISNISPKIEGLVIVPIPLQEPDEVIYVVEIPQSNTAHQNTLDHRYYRRFNFQSVPMLDYEIRDIMNRVKFPIIEIEFEIVVPENMFEKVPEFHLRIIPKNIGGSYAKYINYFVNIPYDIIDPEEVLNYKRVNKSTIEYYGENTYRDVVDIQSSVLGNVEKYGPSRFDPILPGLRGRSEKIKLQRVVGFPNEIISWKVYADNAPPRTGNLSLNDIKRVNK